MFISSGCGTRRCSEGWCTWQYMITLDHVSFEYSRRRGSGDRQSILDDVCLTVPAGSFCGIVGPNGSGKTTLLNLITGQLLPSAGGIRLKDREISQYSIEELARRIAVVPQNLDIRFPFTCLEIVTMGRAPHKKSRMAQLSPADLAIVREAMEFTNTLDFADRLITELSGGERQRVVFAKALAQQPEILFLDEAFANMDVYYSIQCLNLLRRLCRDEGLTVVSIMHDLNLTSAFCTDVAVLRSGRLIDWGPAASTLNPDLVRQVFRIQVVRAGEKGLAILPEL